MVSWAIWVYFLYIYIEMFILNNIIKYKTYLGLVIILNVNICFLLMHIQH